ncbi:MAG: hypothetical protein P1U42_11175 [Phycisphaerales bacterium]|nr:hypothetical protein [Phycisphaerales bacterium]
MFKPQVIVLKFGGSVLLNEQRLRIAVHEIYRWRREGYQVVAVVSALAGRTDELVSKCTLLSEGASRSCKASLLAAGENESASLLGIHLDRAGIPALVLSPASMSLIAEGDPLNSNPVSVNVEILFHALRKDGVVIVPGFVGIDESGAAVTLGRGGSDLSAIFLARSLNADRCRLIKDVDGLYESDPATALSRPRRFKNASYQDALDTDGSIIQHKAIEFAMQHNIEFELGNFNCVFPTFIGTTQSVFDEVEHNLEPTTVAICGLGTVGGGVVDLIKQLTEDFNIIGAACCTPAKHKHLIPFVGRLEKDAIGLAGSKADVVLELIGGVEEAQAIVLNAIRNGSHVISANKALVAKSGERLKSEAYELGVDFRYSASVGGVAPILEAINGTCQFVLSSPVQSVRAVLNGTGNYVLCAIGKGGVLEDSISDAQKLGYAESDPTRDLDGRDSLDKLFVIAQDLGWKVDQNNVILGSINEWVQSNKHVNQPVRHVARVNDGSASVQVEQVDPCDKRDPLAQLENEWNAAQIQYENGITRTIRGKGAGRWPTSESVLADLLVVRRSLIQKASESEVFHV